MSRLIFRPIEVWPGRLTPARDRRTSPFTMEWSTITADLEREIEYLGAHEVVVQLACDERAMRLDGGLRAGANPEHPGVIVSFTSVHGPLQYSVDGYDRWKGNLRAVSLTLTALRAIDRYGATGTGEQYRGWNALPPAREMGAAMSVEEAARLLCDATAEAVGEDPADVRRVASVANSLWREAAKVHHPDAGGEPERFRRLTEARDLLLAVAS